MDFDSSPARYEEYMKAEGEEKDYALQALYGRRKRDMWQIAIEAVLAGFPKEGIVARYMGRGCYHPIVIPVVVNTVMIFSGNRNGPSDLKHVETSDHWIYYGSNCPAPIDAAFVEEYALTPAQIFFLEWSRDWQREILPYWENRTLFTNINEFIEHLKQNAEPVYGPPLVKSASKQ